MRRLLGALALFATGCFGTPTPLAPGLDGSVGVPQSGVQTGAVELPVEGVGYKRLRARHPYYWGQPRMVRLIEDAARAVHDQHPGGKPLLVGDISAKHGGKIPGHNSHRTGRDVDLFWYVTTPSGAPTDNPGFAHIKGDGLAKLYSKGRPAGFVRFDVERQWTLVKTMLLHPKANVQWIFCSHDVEALLIDYARARGEDLALLWYAETVLHQPRDSSPHDDHFHVRLGCLPDEMPSGCEGGGPHWPFLAPAPQSADLTEAELAAIGSDDPFSL